MGETIDMGPIYERLRAYLPIHRLIRVGVDDLAFETMDPSGSRSKLVYLTGNPADRLPKPLEHGHNDVSNGVGDVLVSLRERPKAHRCPLCGVFEKVADFLLQWSHLCHDPEPRANRGGGAE